MPGSFGMRNSALKPPAGQLGEYYGPPEWLCLDCTAKLYANTGLIKADHYLALQTVQTRAARYACHFGSPTTEDELFLLRHDPEGLVRASYALLRGLNKELDPFDSDAGKPLENG